MSVRDPRIAHKTITLQVELDFSRQELSPQGLLRKLAYLLKAKSLSTGLFEMWIERESSDHNECMAPTVTFSDEGLLMQESVRVMMHFMVNMKVTPAEAIEDFDDMPARVAGLGAWVRVYQAREFRCFDVSARRKITTGDQGDTVREEYGMTWSCADRFLDLVKAIEGVAAAKMFNNELPSS